MLEPLKLAGVLALIIVLLRCKWNLGLVLLLASGLTGLLYGRPALELLHAALGAATDVLTVRLILIVLLIALLGQILGRTQQLEGMVCSLTRLVTDRRWLLALLPLLIGLLPMIGGAMFSAPMVAEASRGLPVGRERQTFINYWFRHAMEPVLPLYPSLLLAAGLLGVTPQRLTATQWPLFVAAIGGGIAFGLLGLRGHEPAAAPAIQEAPDRRATWALLARSTWPLVLLLGLALGFGLDLILALLLTIGLLVALNRIAPRPLWALVRAVPLGPVPIIVGAMIFRAVLESSGAVESLAAALARLHVPVPFVVFAAPFMSGLLTGLLTAAFAIGFPIGLPLVGGDPVASGYAMLAYAGGLAGIMLSPMHLCLSLTRDYFQAEWGGLYRRLLPAAGLLLAAVVAVLIIN